MLNIGCCADNRNQGGIMALDQEYEFKVDEQYENEKGVFTVVSIKSGEMEIQWDDGEKILTSVDLQRSIQIRKLMEKRLEEAEAAQKERSAARAAGARNRRFEGFQDGDFKDSAVRTRWRSRDQLGGAVSQKLPRDEHTFLSWAVAQRSEVQWQDAALRKPDGTVDCAVFFVRADTASLTYGFRVSRSLAEDGAARDWNALTVWLQREENAHLLHTIAAENNLVIALQSDAGGKQLVPVENGWQASGAKAVSAATYPAKLMAAGSASAPLAIEIAASIPKADVLARDEGIAVDIASLFERLMPLYRGSVRSHG
jgi:hypothetical protein